MSKGSLFCFPRERELVEAPPAQRFDEGLIIPSGMRPPSRLLRLIQVRYPQQNHAGQSCQRRPTVFYFLNLEFVSHACMLT